MHRSLLLLTILIFVIKMTIGQQTIITDVNLVDVENSTILSNKTIIINGDRIEKIENEIPDEISPNTQVIKGEGKYLSPGLVDAHIHLFQSGGLYTRPDVIDLRTIKPYEAECEWLRANAKDLLKRYLSCGITTVIDVGGPLANFEIRDQFTNDKNTADLFITGPLISTYQPEAFKIDVM